MRYFVPILCLKEELLPQKTLQNKLGGIPWGLPSERWPLCSNCGKSQSLLAQFIHDPIRLDLGRVGRVLSIFQCNHAPGMCPTWEGGSGSNACFVTEPEELLSGLTPIPLDSPPLEREARIIEWIEQDDGIEKDIAEQFFAWSTLSQLPEEEIDKVTTSTRLGGVPFWIQSPDEAPKDGWHFIGQLDSVYSFMTAPNGDLAGVFEDLEHFEDRSHICEGPNFGDSGMAYLFLRKTSTTPEGWFFWQCG